MDNRWLVACLTVSLVAALFAVADPDRSEPASSAVIYTASDPIEINGNSNFTADNGVVDGDGTWSDPYIIEGWDIDLSRSTPSEDLMHVGINVQNTDAFFEIRNVSIHSGNDAVSADDYSILGVLFYNVAFVTIRDSHIDDNPAGMDMLFCSQVNVVNCSLDGNGFGIRTDSCDLVSLLNNSITGCVSLSLEGLSLSDSQLVGNNFSNCTGWTSANLYMAEGCIVNNNTISGNRGLGLNLGYCKDCEVTWNTISNNRVGITMYGSEDMVIEDNTFSGNEENTDFSDDSPNGWLSVQILLVLVVVITVVLVMYLLAKRGPAKPFPPQPGQ